MDVTLVQETLIKNLFQIETLAEHISYTAYTDDAVAHVKERTDSVALLMNPTPVEQVLDVAMAGFTMPQKSTYFYPKMATGLVLNLLNVYNPNAAAPRCQELFHRTSICIAQRAQLAMKWRADLRKER